MLRKILFLNIIFLYFLSASAFSFEKEAEELIQSTTDNAKKIVLDNSIKNEDKKIQIEKIAINVVDVDGLGRFTLGDYKNNLNSEQLEKYTKTFKTFFAKNILPILPTESLNVVGPKIGKTK